MTNQQAKNLLIFLKYIFLLSMNILMSGKLLNFIVLTYYLPSKKSSNFLFFLYLFNIF